MYRRIKTLAALTAVAFIGGASAQNTGKTNDTAQAKSHMHTLSRTELDALLAQPGKILIIDLRRPDEVSRIGGFPVYLSIQPDNLQSSLAWIPKDREIVAVSNHLGRSVKAADLLASKGFKVAGAAGAQIYEQEGGRLYKIAIPPPRATALSAPSLDRQRHTAE
jgi:rhodanese-related sulfurtransferase